MKILTKHFFKLQKSFFTKKTIRARMYRLESTVRVIDLRTTAIHKVLNTKKLQSATKISTLSKLQKRHAPIV